MELVFPAAALVLAALGRTPYIGLPNDVQGRAGALTLAAVVALTLPGSISAEGPTPWGRVMAAGLIAIAAGLTWRVPSRMRTWSMDVGELVLVVLVGLMLLLRPGHQPWGLLGVLGLAVVWAGLGVRGGLRERVGLASGPRPGVVLGAAVVLASAALAWSDRAGISLGGRWVALMIASSVVAGLWLENRPDPLLVARTLGLGLASAVVVGGAMALARLPLDGRLALPLAMAALTVGWLGWRRPSSSSRTGAGGVETSSNDTPRVERETLVVLERLADPLGPEPDDALPSLEHVFPGARMELLRNPKAPPEVRGTGAAVDEGVLAEVCRQGMLRGDEVDRLSGHVRGELRRLGRSAVLLPVSYDAIIYGVLVVHDLEFHEGTFTELRRFADLLGHRLETQRLYAALQHKQRLADLGTFAAALAHDLRGPLGTARLEAQLVQRSIGDSEKASLDSIIRAIDRVIEDLSGTLDFTRTLELALERVELPALVEQCIDEHRALASQQEVELVVVRDEPEGPMIVRAEPARLRRVFDNLVRNALEVSPPGSTVSLRVDAAERGFSVTVADQGEGIDPNLGQRIFEPFVTTKARGVGLGLAISRKIVQAHQGRIVARAGAQGGTHMRVWLPAARPTRPGTPSQSRTRGAS